MTKTLKSLIEETRITADVRYGAKANPTFASSTPWTVTLRYGRKRLTVPFYTGAAITSDPTAQDVLQCLLSDSSGVDNESFENWADSYGYDVDSRSAEATYRACVRGSKNVRRFLGERYTEFCQAEQE